MKKILHLVAILLVLVGCSPSRGAGENPSAPPPEGLLQIVGHIAYVPLEGGFFGIVAEGGQKYDPMNLPEEFRKDGLAVRVEARPRRDVVGFHMWGRIIEIVRIEKRE